MFLNNQLIHADSLAYIQTLPDNCIDLILTDPPYFQVKSCDWDNQWVDTEEYLAWLDDMLFQFWRVLKPTGSLYLFCGWALSAKTEILVSQRLNVLNHIVWAKPSGPWNRMHKPDLRRYFPASERIIFADHYGSTGNFKGNSGYAIKAEKLKQDVFKPLIDYFANARATLNVSAKEINQATGTQMCSHWFSSSQWKLPNEQQYIALQELFARKAKESGLLKSYGELDHDYQVLSKQYSDLKKEIALLKRPFSVTDKVPFTDVWQFKTVSYYQGKHPCEKPADMLEHMITASSREGDVVADFFMGSGSTIKAAIKLNRNYLGVELEEERFLQTSLEINGSTPT